MALPENPINRYESYLAKIAGQAVEVPDHPITREEAYLDYIATHGGGGGGTGDVTGVKGSAERTYRKGNVNITPANLGLPSDAAANIIEKIIVNGTEVAPVNKAVSLTLLTKAVNDLTNYYLKSETYTKAEVDTIIGNLSHLTLEIVASLPTQDISTTTIYLVPVSGQTNVYMQYAYIESTWAQLGTTQVDLSNYYTKSEVDTLLSAKQDSLTFDSTPTASSTNPVTSGGVYNALAGKQDSLTIDSVVTEDSGNPVSSGAVFDALENIPTASGHTIENPSGTAMTARDNLQFTGADVSVTDDETNERTVVNVEGYTTITYSDWLNLTDQEKESGKYYITGAPGADGSIQVDLMTKLWENSDPTQTFAEQNIQLSSDDYDFLLVIANLSTGSDKNVSCVAKKGHGISLYRSDKSTAITNIGRYMNYNSGTSLTVADAFKNNSTDNTYLIPLIIYGIKTTKTIHLNAIASDVSTSADKCMLSDGVTSVEDVVECTQTTAGNYRLRATVSAGGVVSYSWVAE